MYLYLHVDVLTKYKIIESVYRKDVLMVNNSITISPIYYIT